MSTTLPRPHHRSTLARSVALRGCLGAVLASVALLGQACRGPQSITSEPPPACAPACHGCGVEDGCGGSCGCPEEQLCGPQRTCLPAKACTSTCAELGWTCGGVCGQDCGSCPAGALCDAGQCWSAVDVSCPDCSLRLVKAGSEPLADGRRRLTLYIEYHPQAEQPLPRIVDLRLRTHSQATLVDAVAGEALTAAGKALYADPITGQNWRRRPDGDYQFLALSTVNTDSIGAGRLLTLTFEASGPALVRLVKREQVFAPYAADAALQPQSYDNPVVVVQ